MSGVSRRRTYAGFPARRFAVGLAAVLAFLYLVFLLATLPTVPFHPDEATYIYMSRDLDRIFLSGPATVCWSAANAADPLQTERERDAPLARYIIGAARVLGGLPATDANWDWTADWDENLLRGAVPSGELLFLSRIPQALLLFFSVLLIARVGWRLGGGPGAAAAAILYGVNSQVLLHGRRAMSEAALLFGMILTAAVLMEQRREAGRAVRCFGWPLAAGAATALAVSAKYSGLLVLPVALAGMFLFTGGTTPRRSLLLGVARSGVLILGFLAVFLALNPVYWCDPGGTLAAVVAERRRLLAEQVAALRIAAPMQVLDSLPLRWMAPVYEWFIAPPSFWEIPNYTGITAAAEQAYLARPWNTLTSGGIGPGISAVLALFGLGWAGWKGIRRHADGPLILAMIWFLSVFAGILVGVPILWQRYYLPLLPAGAALSAGAVGAMADRVRKERDRISRIGQD
jgi:4-amino-4-deoxy-L-arabinose transferase-like glycosyltransferase